MAPKYPRIQASKHSLRLRQAAWALGGMEWRIVRIFPFLMDERDTVDREGLSCVA